VSTYRPDDLPDDALDLDAITVDWAALHPDWRTRSEKIRYSDEMRSDYANRVRARVSEGLADPSRLDFADHLEERGD